MECEKIRVFGVDYASVKLEDEGDLYVTEYGLPFIENLKPENFWSDRDWFNKNSEALSGTSSVYRVRTKNVGGKSKNIVVKWNRMGQDIPGADDNAALASAEFNTLFEEFSLVMELRNASCGSTGKVITHKPLAIYESPKHVELSRIGRKEYKMHSKIQQHKEINLSMFRLYAVIYEWIEGLDVAQAFEEKILDWNQAESLTLRAQDEYIALIDSVRNSLSKLEIEDLNLRGNHLLLSLDAKGALVLNDQGVPEVRICSFELLKIKR